MRGGSSTDEWKRDLALLVLFLLVCLVAIAILVAQADDKSFQNFHPESIARFGCTINSENDREWRVVVWASHLNDGEVKDHDYSLLLSVRNKRTQAMKDCNRWMDEARKKIREAEHPRAKR